MASARREGVQAYSPTHLHARLPGDWIDDSACAVETSLVVAGDAALRAGTASRERMLAAASALVGQRGITAARGAIAWCDGRHETPGESLAAQLLRGLGYRTVPQLVVDRVEAPGRHDQADLLVEGTRVIVEFDGRGKYDSPGALFAEKRREDELRRLGYVVVRLTWEDLSRPEQVRRRVQAAIALSGSRTA